MGVTIRIHQDTGGGGISGVDSFNSRIGVVLSQSGDYTTAQVMQTPDKNYVTDAEKLAIANTSGTNTGDETPLSVKTKYESNANTNAFTDAEKTKVTNLSGTNTGDETTLSIQTKRPLKTVEGQSLEVPEMFLLILGSLLLMVGLVLLFLFLEIIQRHK